MINNIFDNAKKSGDLNFIKTNNTAIILIMRIDTIPIY